MDGSLLHVTPSSLYGHVTQDLLTQITSGSLVPGAALPTEEELCRQYGVSRITVRRAVADLVARRLVVRKRGVGSFVAGRPAEQREFHLTGFLDETRPFDSRTVLNHTTPADANTAAALRLAPGAAVRHIRTVVHRDGEPFTVADAYTVDAASTRGEEADYHSTRPAAQMLGRRLGRRIERAEQQIDAVAADAVAAELLGVKRGSPMIRARRTYFATGDQPIQFLAVRYHPERYRFIVDLLPRSGSSAFEAHADQGATQPGEQPDGAGPNKADKS